VNGQISGNFVVLQLIGTNGSTIGQIGEPAGSPTNISRYLQLGAGWLHSAGNRSSYMVATSACPGSLGDSTLAGIPGTSVGLNGTTACQQPITLTPAAVTFRRRPWGGGYDQTITLANNSGSVLNNLALQWGVNPGAFDNAPAISTVTRISPTRTLRSPFGASFSLNAGASCANYGHVCSSGRLPVAAISQSGNGQSILGPSLNIVPSLSRNANRYQSYERGQRYVFCRAVNGLGLSSIQPSTPELDFGAEEPLNPPETSVGKR